MHTRRVGLILFLSIAVCWNAGSTSDQMYQNSVYELRLKHCPTMVKLTNASTSHYVHLRAPFDTRSAMQKNQLAELQLTPAKWYISNLDQHKTESFVSLRPRKNLF